VAVRPSLKGAILGRRRPDREGDAADLPIHRWVDDHALDLLEGPETFWGPAPTNWARELLVWAEEQAQERSENAPIELCHARRRRERHETGGGPTTSDDADVAYWAFAIREMLKDIHWDVEGIEDPTLVG
jgi:hypothetical protein